MRRIRVLLVEDSLTVRRRLGDVLRGDPDLEVVGEAENGKRAIELCRALSPDVITLDMILPVMNGLDATEHIMAHCPTPILVVSSSVNRGELFKTYDALAAGAVDVLEKPRGDEPDGDWEGRFRAAVKMVSRIKVITHPRGRLAGRGHSASASAGQPSTALPLRRPAKIVALGASTGGPGALVAVLRALPAPFPIPLVIVLHIDEPFGGPFADWLSAQSEHHVSYAREGAPVSEYAGRVAMAPAGRHLTIAAQRFTFSSEAARHSCRPSIDVLFEAAAREYGASTVACLLTGMGRDGAAGLLEIRRAGGLTIAQDEHTSVVYGMPREAVLLGAAERVLPLHAIGESLATLGRSTAGVES